MGKGKVKVKWSKQSDVTIIQQIHHIGGIRLPNNI